jgi:hypothetical protein
MPKNKQYRSDALAAVHEMMVDLHTVGAIDKHTMRDCDKACLTPVQELSTEEIRATCEHERTNQMVFDHQWQDPFGAWSDLSDTMLDELDQIRHSSQPTLPWEL